MTRAAPLPLDERRAALIAATEPLLEQFGREISTRQIAEAAGIAEGTIFRAFATKEELIDAVIKDSFD
ncbi:MAG TPA: helix-turn-helix domain-containing protein, partial [Propionibacteriaceae bacterium]|nr:helix-turn-helix domain-containing protein [Propionibacteriaceae bacterium]